MTLIRRTTSYGNARLREKLRQKSNQQREQLNQQVWAETLMADKQYKSHVTNCAIRLGPIVYNNEMN